MSGQGSKYRHKESLPFWRDPMELHWIRIMSHRQYPVDGVTPVHHWMRRDSSTMNAIVGLSLPAGLLVMEEWTLLRLWGLFQIGTMILDYMLPSILPEHPSLFDDNVVHGHQKRAEKASVSEMYGNIKKEQERNVRKQAHRHDN